MIQFIFLIVGVCVIVHFIKDRNKNIRNKVLSSWLNITATVTNFEKRIETNSDGDKFTVYIAHAEYYIDNIPYHIEENITQNDMYNLSYINLFYNPIEPNEYITEKGLNCAIVQTKKSIKNYVYQDKTCYPQDETLNKKASNVFLAVFLIPFILVPIIISQTFIGTTIQNSIEYNYVSKYWTTTIATITNIQERTYYDDEGSYIVYDAQGEYSVDGITYSCSKEVNSDSEMSFEVYYNPNDASQYSVANKKNINSLYMPIIFCIFWIVLVTPFIMQLKNPIKIVYLLIMYGGTLINMAYNILIKISMLIS